MDESAVQPTPSTPSRLSLFARWGERLRQNPILLKEFRSRMRGNRAFLILTAYLVILGLMVSLVYALFLSSSQTIRSANDRQIIGKVVFGVVIWMQLMTISFVAPALTAGAISSEREHQTYDLLRTTLLSARSLVLGKFFSGLIFVMLLLFAALPLQSLAFFFGGVAPEEFWIGTALLVVTAITFCAVGIFMSSFINRTLISTVAAYAFSIVLVFGLPMMVVFMYGLFSATLNGVNNQPTPFREVMLLVGGWLLAATNPLITAIVTEVILLQEQSAFLFTIPLSNGIKITLISPWLPTIVIYLVVSVILVWISIRIVRRVEK